MAADPLCRLAESTISGQRINIYHKPFEGDDSQRTKNLTIFLRKFEMIFEFKTDNIVISDQYNKCS